jgi:hypothetical protein
MILIGSALLFIFGITLLFVQAIRIAGSLVKLCYNLIKFAVLVVVAVVLGLWILVWWRRGTTEPTEPVTTDEEIAEEDVPHH